MRDIFDERRSVRAFENAEISEEIVGDLLAAAFAAPSAGNCQPWHVFAVRDEAVKKQLSLDSFSQKFIAQAPVVFVVCAEPARSAARYGERGSSLYCIQDTAALVENLLLKATELGLGACWCGAFLEDAVSKTLALPDSLRPVAIVPVGHPGKKNGKRTPRRPIEEVATYL